MILSKAETQLVILGMVADIMRPPLFDRTPAAPARDQADPSIIAELDRLIATATALRNRVAASATPTPTRTYRNAAEAFRDAGLPFNDQKVRRLCRENAVGKADGAQFAQMLAGTWHVIVPAFEQWVMIDLNAAMNEINVS